MDLPFGEEEGMHACLLNSALAGGQGLASRARARALELVSDHPGQCAMGQGDEKGCIDCKNTANRRGFIVE